MRRRLFAAILAVFFVAAVAASVAPPAARADSAEEFVARVDPLLAPYENVRVPMSQFVLEMWQAEILGWFAEEGINATPNSAQVSWEFLEGVEAQHILGYTNCQGVIKMNVRMANPASPWYGDPMLISTLAHEMAHNQQSFNCQQYPSAAVETGAQLMMFEVLAGMASAGNRLALLALVSELRDVALGVFRYHALDDPAAAERWDAYLAGIDPWARARWERSARFWRAWGGEGQLREILAKYEVVPWLKVVNALKTKRVDRVVAAVQGKRTTLLYDDTVYVLTHLEELLGH